MSDTDDDNKLFLKHMSGVKPLKKTRTIAPTKKSPIAVQPLRKREPSQSVTSPVPEPQESMPIRYKVNKTKPFHEGVSINARFIDDTPITSDSILSYQFDALSNLQQQHITRGLLNIHGKIDLHGLERFEAQDRLDRFLKHALEHHKRIVLVIHGKGGKHGEQPILKQHLFQWLRLQPKVLALHSAHPKHGGTGALYVLLKKTRPEKG